MAACGDLDGGEGYNCLNPLQGGAEPNVILFNFADLTGGVAGVVENSFSALTLVAGKTGYAYEGFGRSVAPQQEVVRTPATQNLNKHQVTLQVFGRGQATKNRIQKIQLGKFVAIVQSSAKDDTAFEVYGMGRGLVLQPGVINQLNENNGAYTLVLATDEGQYENLLPRTLYNTDFETTLAYVKGLAALPQILNMSVLAVAAAGSTAMTITGKGFYGGGVASAIVANGVKWVNQATQAEVTQTSVTVSSDSVLTFSSVALTAGTYKLKITTSKGVTFSPLNVVSA